MNETKEFNVFDEMGNYWAEIADKNSTERQIQFLRNIIEKDKIVLDIACGTGRHMSQLGKEGYFIIGLDLSTKLLKIAKQNQNSLQLIQADMRFPPFMEKSFFTVISMDNSFGYLPSEAADLLSLKSINTVLVNGGLFVLDVFNYEQLSSKHGRHFLFRKYKWRQYPSFSLLQKRTVNKKKRILQDLWVIKRKIDQKISVFNHYSRLYRLNELKEMLIEAGFVVKTAYGSYEKQELNSESNRLIILSEKK